MLKAILTYQLLVSFAAGPLLCCCTTTQLTAALSPPPTRTESAPASHRGCCHGHQPTKKGTPAQDAPEKPGDKAPCPCKESPSQVDPALPERDTSGAALTLRTLAFDCVAVTDFSGAFNLSPVFPSGHDPSAPTQHLSTGDILFAHHNLRC